MDFASTLKNLRKAKEITQEQLAKYLKVSRPTVAGYETKNHQPDYERLKKIAEFFDVSVDYLLSDAISSPSETNTEQIDEDTLDIQVQLIYQSLNANSKREALRYLKLLQLKEQK